MEKTLKTILEEKNQLEKLDVINNASEVIVYLGSGKSYLYNGKRQFKLHEQNSWMFCESYKTNEEYINGMYNVQTITKIECLYPTDSWTVYLK